MAKKKAPTKSVSKKKTVAVKSTPVSRKKKSTSKGDQHGANERPSASARGKSKATKKGVRLAATDEISTPKSRKGSSKSDPSRAIEPLAANATALNTSGARNANGRRDAESAAVSDICRQLVGLGRFRNAALRSRITIDRQLESTVVNFLGRGTGANEDDRKTKFALAARVIKLIYDGADIPPELQETVELVRWIVVATQPSRDAFERAQSDHQKKMLKLVKQLPVVAWCQGVRGFGLNNLAAILAETGDLSLYLNPAKVWKRLGMAPFHGRMCSTWRREGGLSKEDWKEAGYSPRRRSVGYVVGECMLKANKGEYRQRYEEAKAKLREGHPEWEPDEHKQHCHRHGMLVMVKRLIRNLWREWRGQKGDPVDVPAPAPKTKGRKKKEAA